MARWSGKEGKTNDSINNVTVTVYGAAKGGMWRLFPSVSQPRGLFTQNDSRAWTVCERVRVRIKVFEKKQHAKKQNKMAGLSFKNNDKASHTLVILVVFRSNSMRPPWWWSSSSSPSQCRNNAPMVYSSTIFERSLNKHSSFMVDLIPSKQPNAVTVLFSCRKDLVGSTSNVA